jgi:multimeric flavodoxin WrbA
MELKSELVRQADISTARGRYTLSIEKEDLSKFYPGMVRFTVRIDSEEGTLCLFRTNSYEYSPTVSLEAESVAHVKADEWEDELRNNTENFIEYCERIGRPVCMPSVYATDVIIVQGSPRADGNCSILAGWAADTARDLKRTVQVLFPDDMDIRSCIGCYQCYNTGTCVFEDDMSGIIHAISEAELLVICSPVYTNTVPGGLKLFIDRCQAFHASRTLGGARSVPRGLLLSVAGRRGRSNFTCVKQVIDAFMGNLGIMSSGEIFLDRMDEVWDVRAISGVQEQVQDMVRAVLQPHS